MTTMRKTFTKTNVNELDSKGETAMHEAALANNEKTTQRLLDLEADANIKNKDGQTPLMLAAKNGNSEVTELIVKHSDVNLQDNNGMTALMHAVTNLRRKSARIVMNDEKSNLSLKTVEGKTALDLLVEKMEEQINFFRQEKIRTSKSMSYKEAVETFRKKSYDCLRGLLEKDAELSSANAEKLETIINAYIKKNAQDIIFYYNYHVNDQAILALIEAKKAARNQVATTQTQSSSSSSILITLNIDPVVVVNPPVTQTVINEVHDEKQEVTTPESTVAATSDNNVTVNVTTGSDVVIEDVTNENIAENTTTSNAPPQALVDSTVPQTDAEAVVQPQVQPEVQEQAQTEEPQQQQSEEEMPRMGLRL